jgi:MFS family permease
MPAAIPGPQKLTMTHWLILIVAAIGFAFDIYELLMLPLIARPALMSLLHVDPDTSAGFQTLLSWNSYIMYGSAVCGGIFGLLGGYLTDLFGRRKVLVWSILLYAFSALAAGFSTSAEMLLVLRCTTFIGVCVEFVAAVAWLSELFPNPQQREKVLGYTQAFSSFGGLLVALAYKYCIAHADALPAIQGEHVAWRYTLISGLIPAIPLILIRPFMPESPAWREKRLAGTLKRPSFAALFSPALRRTSIVTMLLFACAYGAAFGAIQFIPQIVPGLVAEGPQIKKLSAQLDKAEPGSDEYKSIKKEIGPLAKAQQEQVANTQFYQETGGLVGRFALAFLAVIIVSRRKLLWLFQVPGLILLPLVFWFAGTGKLGEDSLFWLRWGIAGVGFFTVAQLSFWGNYLPRVYPVHLRGTGEGFAANVGGRLLGTLANPLTYAVFSHLPERLPELKTQPHYLAAAAAMVGCTVYLLGVILCAFLPEPPEITD